MAAILPRPEERLGLIVAVLLHGALLGVLLLRPASRPMPLPERIAVTLSDKVGLTDTAPKPQAAPAPEAAPLLGDPAPAPIAQPVAKPAPKVMPLPVPLPRPHITPRIKPQIKPKPVARPEPAPSKAPAAKPAPPHKAKPHAVPDPIADALAGAKPGKKPAGASKIGSDFLKGVPGGQSGGKAAGASAKAVGPEVQAALRSSLSRQLKPYWRVPQGVDTDELVTYLTFDLNPDGTLAGAPHVLRQEGITDSNRPQAAVHREQAIRAVRLAAPYLLPPQYFEAWKHVASFRFDRRLSQ